MSDGEVGPALGPAYARSSPVPRLTERQLTARSAILASDHPKDYETIPCPCGSRGPDPLLRDVDRPGLPARNVVCQPCGLVRLPPRWREDRSLRFYEAQSRSLYTSSPLPRPVSARWVAALPATRERTA